MKLNLKSPFQMYHNNVLEFYIVTTDENECNWMMFVRKARHDDNIKPLISFSLINSCWLMFVVLICLKDP